MSSTPGSSPRAAAERRRALGLTVERGRERVVVRLTGELDLAVADQLRVALTAARRGALLVEVDLAELSFMDCAGIAVLVEERRRALADGYELAVTGASGEVARLLALTGLGGEPAAEGRPAATGPRPLS